MTKLEKVVKGLEICNNCDYCSQTKECGCPYVTLSGCDRTQLYIDAYEILKKIQSTIKAENKSTTPIDYEDCANAMLKMWMENILTDAEYNRIMDKLNKAHKEEKI